MFTGIIEAAIAVAGASDAGGLRRISLDFSALADWEGIRLGDSVALNGCCLTVATMDGSKATFEAVPQTLSLTNLAQLKPGAPVNIERAMRAGGRLDGHLVQGHVDRVGTVVELIERGGEWRVRVECGTEFAAQCLERGSVCIDGISLTIAQLGADSFTVAVIPHTRQITNVRAWRVGTSVNLEADVIGKYVRRQMQQIAAGVTPELLRRAGFAP